MSLERRSSRRLINPREHSRALFLSMFLVQACSYSDGAGAEGLVTVIELGSVTDIELRCRYYGEPFIEADEGLYQSYVTHVT